jgi:cholest-4-en-3-one 26-monooxygenase
MAAATFAPDLLSASTFAAGPPHEIFDRLREEAPVYGQADPINGGTVWSLTRFADIREVSMDRDRFTITQGHQFPTTRAYAAAMRDNIMFNDPPRHTRLRSFAAAAFSPRVVARFETWIRGLCVEIIDNLLRNERIDMIPMVAAELPGQVIASIMGVPDKDRHNLIDWATAVFGRLDPEIGLEKAMAGVATVREYARELRALKQREPGVDMTSELLKAEFEGAPITEAEFVEMVMSLVLAGFETTHTLIAQGLVLMARDADVRRQVDEAPASELGNVVEEMLRYVSPVMHMARTATEDLELRGQRIAKGDTVVMWFTAANRDRRAFDDPHLFIGTRGRRNHAAFGGGGPHFCLGNHLARLEGEILFDEMRKRGVRLELDGEPQRASGIFINAMRQVPMRVVRAA